MVTRLLLLICILLGSCSKKESYPSNVNAIGHGGMGIASAFPMNSFESLVKSLALGAAGTEIDVQMTKDGILVAYHDETLESSTNFSGRVHDYNWEDLQHAFYTVSPYLNYKICSLDDFFGNLPQSHAYEFILDIKLFQSDQDFMEKHSDAILETVSRYQLENNVILESKDTQFLQHFQHSQLRLSYFTFDFQHGLQTAIRQGYFALSIGNDKITKNDVAEAHSKGIKISAFNVSNHSQNRQAAAKGIDYIQSDRIKHLLNLLRNQR